MANPNQVTNLEADRREESPHLAFSPLGHDHLHRGIRSGSLHAERSSRPVLELDSERQLLELSAEMSRSRVAR